VAITTMMATKHATLVLLLLSAMARYGASFLPIDLLSSLLFLFDV
jgi:hypothetical protein